MADEPQPKINPWASPAARPEDLHRWEHVEHAEAPGHAVSKRSILRLRVRTGWLYVIDGKLPATFVPE